MSSARSSRGIRLVLELGHLVHHREEVAGVAQVVVRIDVRLPHVVAVGERRQRRHLGHEPHDLLVADVGVLDLRRVGIERREGADRGDEHAHRVGVVAEALHERLDVLVHERVDRDLVRPRVELGLRRQLAVDQEVGDLEVGRLLRQLLDRVAAVLQHAVVAVEVGDGRATRRRVHERRVVRHQAEVVVGDLDLAQRGGADRAVLDRDLVRLARPVVRDGQRVGSRSLRHRRSWSAPQFPYLHYGSDGPQAVSTELAIAPMHDAAMLTRSRRAAPRASRGTSGDRMPTANRATAQTAASPPRM